MDNGRMPVDEYIHGLISDQKFRNNEYRKLIKNGYDIDSIEGNASPDVLGALIQKAKRNKHLQDLLVGLLPYTDENSITEYNFSLLCSFRKRTRNAFLSQITHSQLSFCQMADINRLCGDFEAFAWLFDTICCHNIFCEEDMLRILKDNNAVTSYGIQVCIDLAHQKHGQSRKLEIAREWLKDME